MVFLFLRKHFCMNFGKEIVIYFMQKCNMANLIFFCGLNRVVDHKIEGEVLKILIFYLVSFMDDLQAIPLCIHVYYIQVTLVLKMKTKNFKKLTVYNLHLLIFFMLKLFFNEGNPIINWCNLTTSSALTFLVAEI